MASHGFQQTRLPLVGQSCVVLLASRHPCVMPLTLLLPLAAASPTLRLAASCVQWCAVERSPRQYSWTGYRQLFEMVRGAGLKLQVVLSFHACGGNVGDLAQVPLPSWVLEVRVPGLAACRNGGRL
eukprot:GHRQ01040222.1.p2 GENE.GHRQ01040222.1~~GHRQ01040222.1.p2  ORF type:complete len:126 (+),score=27.58 GHRQ01040222.1:465-842(+)